MAEDVTARVSRLVRAKVSRLQGDHAPRVLDLFSGCGGLFLGFHRAGCVSVGGVELDPLAARSFAKNFHGDLTGRLFEEHAASKDITAPANDPLLLLRRLGHDEPERSVDLIVGGPPCPAFARVGRAKLREIHNHPEAFRQDPRAQLYLPYLRYVEALAPIAIVMENVPDILNFGGHNLAEEICEALEDLGYVCAYSLLNSANYGVPQMRERFFLIAIHRQVGVAPAFPVPTNNVIFPSGYNGARQVALKHLGLARLFPNDSRYVKTPEPPAGAAPPVSAACALGDLPPITAHLRGLDKRGARRFNAAVAYREDVEPSEYARQMKRWPGFEGTGHLLDHVTRCLSDRDYRLFKKLRPGDEYPEAFALAQRLFSQALSASERAGYALKPGSAGHRDLRKAYVPPYDPGKFPNKWRKMEANAPARTLMAHLGKDGYSHIHYDSAQARVISVREAARLQSFPDGFHFCGTMNPAFRQIGNSVPPLMSFALAKALLGTLAGTARKRAPGHRAGANARSAVPFLETPF